MLFVAPTVLLQSGGEISHLELIKDSVQRGYKVHVIVPGEGELSSTLEELSIAHTVIPYGWWNEDKPSEITSFTNIRAVRNICDVISKNKIDYVITNTLNLPWAALAASLTRKPHIWIAREFSKNEFGYLSNRYDFIDSFSNLVIANSEELAKHINNDHGVPAKYFYSYVDADDLKLGQKDKVSNIINVGLLSPRKNQLELIQAAARIKKKRGLKNKIVFIGDFSSSKYAKLLKDTVKNSGLENNVRFIPFTKKPWQLVASGDIFVQTSSSESIGRTVTEAMKLGLICVGANIEGTKEAFSLGGGSTYKKGEPADLAKLLMKIMDSHDNFLAQAQLAQKRALKNMSKQACHKNFFESLEKISSSDSSVHGLSHILPHIDGLIDYTHTLGAANEKHIGIVNQQQASLNRIQQDLTNVVDSRGWKMVLAGRKAMGRKPGREVYFVYSQRFRESGSTVMRGFQLSEIARKFLTTRYSVSYSPFETQFKDSILFLTKGVLKTINLEGLEVLKNNGNCLVFDPVDEDIPKGYEEYADVIVAASRTAFDDYRKAFPDKRVVLVDHHVDPRVLSLNIPSRTRKFRAGYFGELVNTVISPEIEKRVDFIPVDTSKQADEWFKKLPPYTLHYAIRQKRDLDNHKPFLKGFTAAACKANIIIQDGQTEALKWLGNDYPYLLKKPPTESNIVEMLDYARESYGSKEWMRGLAIMEDIARKTSDEAVGRQLLELFKEL